MWYVSIKVTASRGYRKILTPWLYKLEYAKSGFQNCPGRGNFQYILIGVHENILSYETICMRTVHTSVT